MSGQGRVLSLILWMALGVQFAAQTPRGSLRVHVAWKRASPAPRELFVPPDLRGVDRHWEDLILHGPHRDETLRVDAATGGLSGVLLTVRGQGVSSERPPAPKGPSFVVQGLEIHPRLAVGDLRRPIRIVNRDAVLYRFVLLDGAQKPTGVVTVPAGESVEVPGPGGRRFGIMEERLHEMEAWMASSDGGLVLTTGVTGDTLVEGLPEGPYDVEAFHPLLGVASKRVKIGSGKETLWDLDEGAFQGPLSNASPGRRDGHPAFRIDGVVLMLEDLDRVAAFLQERYRGTPLTRTLARRLALESTLIPLFATAAWERRQLGTLRARAESLEAVLRKAPPGVEDIPIPEGWIWTPGRSLGRDDVEPWAGTAFFEAKTGGLNRPLITADGVLLYRVFKIRAKEDRRDVESGLLPFWPRLSPGFRRLRVSALGRRARIEVLDPKLRGLLSFRAGR